MLPNGPTGVLFVGVLRTEEEKKRTRAHPSGKRGGRKTIHARKLK